MVLNFTKDRNPAQRNLYTTNNFGAAGDTFFGESKSCNLNGEKVILMLVLLQDGLRHYLIFLLVLFEQELIYVSL